MRLIMAFQLRGAKNWFWPLIGGIEGGIVILPPRDVDGGPERAKGIDVQLDLAEVDLAVAAHGRRETEGLLRLGGGSGARGEETEEESTETRPRHAADSKKSARL